MRRSRELCRTRTVVLIHYDMTTKFCRTERRIYKKLADLDRGLYFEMFRN